MNLIRSNVCEMKTAAEIKTQIIHCHYLYEKIMDWCDADIVDFDYVERWEIRLNRIATQLVESYAKQQMRDAFIGGFDEKETVESEGYEEAFNMWYDEFILK